jgi:PAS domain S-box-containing protein
MTKKTGLKNGMSELRSRAEAQLGGNTVASEIPQAEHDLQRMFHELQVLQIELEMQNEELFQSRDDLQDLVEKALRSEENYRTLLNSLIEGFCIIEVIFDSNGLPADYLFMETNAAFAEQSGLQNAQGKLLSEVFPQRETYWFEYFGKVVLTGESARFVAEAKSLDRWYDVSAYRVDGPNSVKVAVFFNDITKRVKSESELRLINDALERRVAERTEELTAALEELQRSEKRYRSVVEGQTDVISRFLADGKFIFVNDVYCRLFGKSKEELLGHTWHPVVFSADVPIVEEKLQAISVSNPVVIIENRVYSGTGKVLWMQFVNSGFFDKEGRLVEIQSVGRDITERKQIEDELRSYARRLIVMEEALRKQIATELHDEIGRDLTVLGMNLMFVRDNIPDDTLQNLCARVDDSGRLVEDISSTVRGIMSSLRPPVLDDFGLLAALHWYADLFLRRTGIRVLVLADEPFPRLLNEKETALFRIVQEALVNAAKYAETLKVTIQLRIKDGLLRLSVIDRGNGFNTAKYRTISSDSGWGLIIMRERAELIGAKLYLESSPGKGTTISVVLAMEET